MAILLIRIHQQFNNSIQFNLKIRMIWKEWNSDYVAEMPYLTPIKVWR